MAMFEGLESRDRSPLQRRIAAVKAQYKALIFKCSIDSYSKEEGVLLSAEASKSINAFRKAKCRSTIKDILWPGQLVNPSESIIPRSQ
jgi:hypothetical protein